jgi:hypothetical protein
LMFQVILRLTRKYPRALASLQSDHQLMCEKVH